MFCSSITSRLSEYSSVVLYWLCGITSFKAIVNICVMLIA
jgi:hypothetical protein